MSPLGSTNTETTQAVTSCGLFVFIPSITITVDRHKRRVNGVARVLNGNGANTLKPAVINGYTLPLSSTKSQNHARGDAAWLFVINRRMLLVMTVGDGDYDGQIRRYLTVNSDQNRYSDTVNRYRRTPFEVRHG
jgi:hypothetical protein